MTDKNLETLIQNVVDTIKDIQDLNILVRRLPENGQALARMNERVDATQFAIQSIEKVFQSAGEETKGIHTTIESIQTILTALQTESQNLPERISIPSELIETLKTNILSLSAQLAIPLTQRIEHHHHLQKGMWISIILFLLSIGLVTLLVNSHNQVESEREHDIKYRALELINNTALEKTLQSIDSSYLTNPGDFRKIITRREEQLQKAIKDRQEADRKKEEWKKSEEKAKEAR
jgi:hypothetical protein